MKSPAHQTDESFPQIPPEVDETARGPSRSQPLLLNWRAAAKGLATIIAIVIVSGATANYAIYNLTSDPHTPLADVLKRFDLGHEPSIPAFYSASMMLACSGLLALLGHFDITEGIRRKPYWYGLSLLFFALAVDEAVMFHEMGTAFMERLGLSGPFYFSWVIPGLLFVALVFAVFVRFVLTLNRRTSFLFIAAAGTFIAGAVGMEIIAGAIFAAAETEEQAMSSLSHVVVQAIEEGLEMAGVAIFFCALLDYAERIGLRVAVLETHPHSSEGV